MSASPKRDELLASLGDRLQAHIDILLNQLSGQHDTEEIESEIISVHELIDAFSKVDRRLEKLLDAATPTAEVRQIVEALPDPVKTVAENRKDLMRLHSVSHQLIARSTLLVINAQRLIDQSQNQTSRYAREVCGFCEGFGSSIDSPCPACHGQRSVLVHQPAIKCPRCKGTGKADSCEPSVRCYGLCTVCLGSGWALRLGSGHEQH